MNDIDTAYERLKEKQDSLEPYLPIRMIAETLRVSKDTAQALLRELIKQGRAKKYEYGRGIKSRYRIL